jgi:DNA-directed RNA polymerase beta' subunit
MPPPETKPICGEPTMLGVTEALQMYMIPDSEFLARSVQPIHVKSDLLNPSMGISELTMICPTCQNKWDNCTGHWGHIQLPSTLPLFRPLFLRHLVTILNCICYYCRSILIAPDHPYRTVLEALPMKQRLDFASKVVIKECGCCHKEPIEFVYSDKDVVPRIIVHLTDQDYSNYQRDPTRWTPIRIGPKQIYDALDGLSAQDVQLLGLTKYNAPVSHMHTLIPVAPMNVRPAHVLEGQVGGRKAVPNDWTRFYKLMFDYVRELDSMSRNPLIDCERGINLCSYEYQKVVCTNGNFHSLLSVQSQTMSRGDAKLQQKANKEAEKRNPVRYDDLQTKWLKLQSVFAAFVSRAHLQRQLKSGPGKYLPRGSVESRFDGQKNGRMRKHVTASRTDNNGRAVLSGDVHQHPMFLGVPMEIARKLTVKVRVTDRNVREAQTWILRGPFEHPGANYVVMDDGSELDLSFYENRRTLDMERVIYVHRHLQNGDWVLGNRQPTIHRHSMISFKVRVHSGYTLNIHESLLTPIGGDFDGDEVNIFLYTGMLAQAELSCIAPPTEHIMKDGRVLIKFIQNAVIGMYLMTADDVFFSRDQAMSLVCAVSQTIWELPVPAILRPRPLWTGKQLVSLIIPRVVHVGERVSGLPNRENPVDIVAGQLLQGQLTDFWINGGHGILQAIVREGRNRTDVLDFVYTGFLMAQYYLSHHECISAGYFDLAEDRRCEDRLSTLPALQDCLQMRSEIVSLTNKASAYVDGLGAYVPDDNVAVERSISDLIGGLQEKNTQYTKAYLSLMSRCVDKNAMVVAVESGAKSSWPSLAQMFCHLGQVYTQKGRYAARAPYLLPGQHSLQSYGLVTSGLSQGLDPVAVMSCSPATTESVHGKNSGTANSGYQFRIMVYACMTSQTNHFSQVVMADQVIWQVYGGDGYDPQWLGTDRVRLLHLEEWDIVSTYATCECELSRILDQSIVKGTWGEILARDPMSFPMATDWIAYLTDEVSTEWLSISEVSRSLMVEELLQLLSLHRHLRVHWSRQASAKSMSIIKSPFQMNVVFERCLSTLGVPARSNILPVHAVQSARDLWAYLVSERLVVDSHRALKCLFFDWLSAHNIIRVYRLTWDHLIWIGRELIRRCARVCVAPGEGVGPYAAQNVGEPYTQSSLKSTHASGKQLASVSGVKRMSQLINNNHGHASNSIVLKSGCTARDAFVLGMSITRSYMCDVCTGFPVVYTRATDCVIVFTLDREKVVYRVMSIQGIVLQLVSQTLLTLPMFDMSRMTDPGPWTIRVYVPYTSEFWTFFERAFRGSTVMAKAGCMAQNLYARVIIGGLPDIDTFVTDQVVFHTRNQRMDARHRVVTQGSALAKILRLPLVDVTLSTSTDVNEMHSVYGLLAARQTLMTEFQQVMGSMVDSRHLEIFMRVMTTPYGIESMKVNQVGQRLPPLLRMSFESCMKQAVEVTVRGARDMCNTVPSAVIAHRPIRVGTGYNLEIVPIGPLIRPQRVSRPFCPYVFSPKADGLRVTLVLYSYTSGTRDGNGSPEKRRVAAWVDRASTHIFLASSIEQWPEHLFHGTILDGELVICPFLKRPLYLVFDCYSVCGNRCTRLRYDHRLELAREVVSRLVESDDSRDGYFLGMRYLMKEFAAVYPSLREETSYCAKAVKGETSDSSIWYMLVKPIFDMSGLAEFPMNAFPWRSDGFVFTNLDRAATPFRMERETFMKWKPLEHITVDFILQSLPLATTHTKVQAFEDLVCQPFRVFSHGTHALFVDVPSTGSRCFSLVTCPPDIRVKSGDVVECAWVTLPFPQWVVQRVRYKDPNQWSTVLPTLQNIVDGIRVEDFPRVDSFISGQPQ